VALLALSGCGCDEDRPYTPFQVASSLPGAADDAPPPAPTNDPAAPDPAASTLVLRATGLPETWEAFGRELRAPKGTGFAAAVELPREGGAAPQVLAWVFPKPSPRPRDGGLVELDARGRASQVLTKVPEFLPSGPDCELDLASLEVTRTSIASVLRAKCKGRLLPGTATGAFLLTSREKRAPFSLRLSEETGQKDLSIGTEGFIASAGAKGAELALVVDLEAPGGAHAKLPLRFVEKAGGLSRIADAPSADLETLVKELAGLVPKKKERELALGRIDAVRRWVYAVCAEAGATRLEGDDGRAFACGRVKPSLDALTEAAIEAYLYRDEPWKAIGEYERADFFLGAPPAKTKERWAARIAKKTSTVAAEIAAEYPLRLGLDVPYPVATPLGFDERGALYGLTASGEVAPFAPSAPPADAGTLPPDAPPPAPEPVPSAWPLRPKSSDGRLLAALVPSCDRAEAQLSFLTEGGAASPSIVLPFLAPRPCHGLSAKPLPAVPLAWQGPALFLIAAGEPLSSAGSWSAPARPIAWGTSLGVEVWTSAGHVSWRGPGLRDLHHCVTPESGGGAVQQVACVRGKTAVLLRRKAEASAP